MGAPFVRTKTIKGHVYWYLVVNTQEGRKRSQRVLAYLGKAGSKAAATRKARKWLRSR
jgi:hypothetical protein